MPEETRNHPFARWMDEMGMSLGVHEPSLDTEPVNPWDAYLFNWRLGGLAA